jgi:hypothetical protein
MSSGVQFPSEAMIYWKMEKALERSPPRVPCCEQTGVILNQFQDMDDRPMELDMARLLNDCKASCVSGADSRAAMGRFELSISRTRAGFGSEGILSRPA